MSTFNYFSYGSNLLKSRIKLKNPSVKQFAIGILNKYQLTFSGYSQLWQGAVANIIPNDKENLLGMVWILNNEDLSNLDEQEIFYERILVKIVLLDNSIVECWTYVQTKEFMNSTNDTKPSAKYKKVMLKGILENNFPQEYINKIKKIEDNGILNCGPKLDL